MTDTIARLEKLLEKAHARPWGWRLENTFHGTNLNWKGGDFAGIYETQNPIANAEAICAAMNALPQLLLIAKKAKSLAACENFRVWARGDKCGECDGCELEKLLDSLKCP